MSTSVRSVRPVLALAGIESLRHLRSPILWLGTAATIAQAAGPYADGQGPRGDPWVTTEYDALFAAWGWLLAAAFTVAVLTASRHDRPDATEVLAGQPTDAGQRVTAVLLAAVVPAALAGLAAGATCAVVGRAGGIATGDVTASMHLMPTTAEAASAIALVTVGYALGVAAALTIASRIVNVVFGALIAVLGVAMFWMWFYPLSIVSLFALPLQHTDLGPDPTDEVKARWQILHGPVDPVHAPHWAGVVRDTDMIAWHAVYLTGVALLLGVYSVRRAGGRSTRWPAIAGSVLAVGGASMQIVAHGGAGH